MTDEPSFTVHTPDGDPGERLLVAFAGPGVAALSAVDYLVERLDTTQVGHVRTHGLPDVTPFTEGRPRHPVRLYNVDGTGVTVLGSEVFLPAMAADGIVDTLTSWVADTGIQEVTALHGGTFPHSEEQHAVFQVATDGYRERHFADDEVEPLAGGFFDGVVAELLTRALDGELPPTGVLVTPAHLPGPDLDAAVHLLDGLGSVYDLDIDADELRQRSAELRQYYGDLAERMETLREGASGPDYLEDRMYM